MRKISCTAYVALLAVLGTHIPAAANDVYNLNQTGFTLPGVSLPQGQDEVRAADGTTCRSSISGSGAYLDVGVVGGRTATQGMATYGRVVVPLGKRPKRIDCSRLYALEIERLELEIRMLKMGIAGGQQTEANWANEGWSNESNK